MARDYQVRKYIADNAAKYDDSRLTKVLVKAFDLICSNEEPNGCMSSSVALHVILRSLGYEPKLCYGLCVTPLGNEIYHAWLELNGEALDIAIYGNSHFSPFWNDAQLLPVVFENYNNTAIRYRDHVFDEDWKNCMISQAVNMGSIANYIAKAPHAQHPSGNGIWKLIFSILDETYTRSKQESLQCFVSKEAFQCQDQ